MIDEFADFIGKNRIFAENEKILVAVSGGVDSTVLCELLHRCGYNISIAHCNFGLRGDESDGDEEFVRQFAAERNTEFITKRFDTTDYAKNNSLSIEMAARELRYAWFRQTADERGFTKIALAHHRDDQIETFIINLLRGSGIHGLKAMKPVNGIFVRPLLWASRAQIEAFAVENGLPWRNDHTNAEDIFLRNRIRHNILPELDRISENARRSIGLSIDYLSAEDDLYRQLIDEKISSLSVSKGDTVSIIKSVFKSENGKQLLFEWLREYGFSFVQCSEMLSDGVRGRKFLSPTHIVTDERETLDLKPIKPEDTEPETEIHTDTPSIDKPLKMSFGKAERHSDFQIIRTPETAQVDFDKLTFPLRIRRWRKGDRFKPFGMKGSKLLGDFFNDLGFTTTDKENTRLLVTADDLIVWVIGHRIDGRFAISESTRTVFSCTKIQD